MTLSQLSLPGLDGLPGPEPLGAVQAPRLISVSRRADIPAFQTPWLLRQLEQGWVDTVNPLNARQVSRVSLRPEHVAGLVFWTRDPRPLAPHLEALRRRGLDWHILFTVVGQPRWLAPGDPPLARSVAMARELAARFGPERLTWRYDPMVFTPRLDAAWHAARFSQLAEALAGAACRVVTSLMAPYGKAARRLAEVAARGEPTAPATRETLLALLPAMHRAARAAGLPLQHCASPALADPALGEAAIAGGPCLDGELFRGRLGWPVAKGRDGGQRPACGCAPSRDIGTYDACPRGCAYCYAVRDFSRARERWRQERRQERRPERRREAEGATCPGDRP